jgi:hypothetical protein
MAPGGALQGPRVFFRDKLYSYIIYKEVYYFLLLLVCTASNVKFCLVVKYIKKKMSDIRKTNIYMSFGP